MIEPYHHTSKPFVNRLHPDYESFEDFLDKYELEIDRIKTELGTVKDALVGLEIPEGLKKFSHDLIAYLEKSLNTKIILSGDTCFGACDIKYYQFETLGINKIIHFGNVAISNRILPKKFKVVYVPLYMKIGIDDQITKAVAYLSKNKIENIGLISSVQYIKNVPIAKKALTAAGINVFVGKGTDRVGFAGQVLGCNPSSATKVMDKVDVFVMFEGGGFHALPVSLATHKDVICFDPVSGDTNIYEYKKLLKLHRTKLTALKQQLKKAKKVGFIISNKFGQSRMESLLKLQKEYEKGGYITDIVLVDFFNSDSINSTDFDILVSTLCPRVALDEREKYLIPILSTTEAIAFIRDPKNLDKSMVFDQIN